MSNPINTKEYYDSCIIDCNDYDSLMKGHYKFVLDVTEVQKVCLNVHMPRNVLPKEIEDLSMSWLCPIMQTKVQLGQNILDVGCGAGTECFLASDFVGEKGKIVGIDPVPLMIEKANFLKQKYSYSNVNFYVGYANKLNFENAYFDIITMNYSFHIEQDKLAALSEAWRVLKDNGLLIIADSFTPKTGSIDIDKGEFFFYAKGAISVEEFFEMSKKAGFKNCTFNQIVDSNISENPYFGYMIVEK